VPAENPQVSEITDSYHDLHTEIHEALRILREIEQLVTKFRPLLDGQANGWLAQRAARRSNGGRT